MGFACDCRLWRGDSVLGTSLGVAIGGSGTVPRPEASGDFMDLILGLARRLAARSTNGGTQLDSLALECTHASLPPDRPCVFRQQVRAGARLRAALRPALRSPPAHEPGSISAPRNQKPRSNRYWTARSTSARPWRDFSRSATAVAAWSGVRVSIARAIKEEASKDHSPGPSALRSEEGRIDGIQRIHNGSEDGVSLCVLPGLSSPSSQDPSLTLPKFGEHFFVCATIAFGAGCSGSWLRGISWARARTKSMKRSIRRSPHAKASSHN